MKRRAGKKAAAATNKVKKKAAEAASAGKSAAESAALEKERRKLESQGFEPARETDGEAEGFAPLTGAVSLKLPTDQPAWERTPLRELGRDDEAQLPPVGLSCLPCSSARLTQRVKSGEKVQLLGQCRLSYEKPAGTHVRMHEFVAFRTGSAMQEFSWTSQEFRVPAEVATDIALTLSAIGNLQSLGINSRANLQLLAALERARDRGDGEWGEWSPASGQFEWRASVVPDHEVTAEVKGIGFEIGGFGTRPVNEPKILWLSENLALLPGYKHRVRVVVSAEATTGAQLLLSPQAQYLFNTTADFDVRGRASREDRGITWKQLTVTTH